MSGAAPAAIAAISIAYLQATGRLTDLLDAFFAHLAVPEQVCLCSLLLSALCLVSSISGFVHEAKAGAAARQDRGRRCPTRATIRRRPAGKPTTSTGGGSTV